MYRREKSVKHPLTDNDGNEITATVCDAYEGTFVAKARQMAFGDAADITELADGADDTRKNICFGATKTEECTKDTHKSEKNLL